MGGLVTVCVCGGGAFYGVKLSGVNDEGGNSISQIVFKQFIRSLSNLVLLWYVHNNNSNANNKAYNNNYMPYYYQHLGTGWCVSVSQPPAEVCLTDLAWDYPGV